MAKRDMNYAFDTGNVGADGQPLSDDSILVKFIIAQVLALSLAAIHGIVQRLGFMAEWLREADYGGHLITNLGLTHINVVAGGTIAIAGLTYYTLPRVLHRPMWSKTLCNVSFWFTICGVLGFYLALWPIGLAEGNLVQQGYTYAQAKDIVGFWHKFPEAVTASIMGIGYWVYVTNVVMTIWQGRRDTRREERFAAKFFLVATVSLFLGTLQGVYQVLPWSLDWLYKTGAAGQLIDPASHSHMNLIGGCVIGFMGFTYYFLPRILGHRIYSVRLANFSFWMTFIGVYCFWLTFITLGFIEGDMVIRDGITAIAAKERLGIWHSLPIATVASIMAIGLWSFIANTWLTIRMGLGEAKERYIGVFMAMSTLCMFVSTTQGIIQILPSTAKWIEQAREGGELVLLMAHPQLNIIGVVTLTLISIGTYALPRMTGRRMYSHKLAKFYLSFLTFGVFLLYFTTLTLGILEGNIIRQGKTFAQARQQVTGGLHDWIFVTLYAIIGISYACYAVNVLKTIGKERLVEGFSKNGRNFARVWRKVLEINIPATSLERAQREAAARSVGASFTPDLAAADSGVATELASTTKYAADSGSAAGQPSVSGRTFVANPNRILNQNLLGIVAFETIGGWLAFLGVGWLRSRRPAMGIGLFTVWQTGIWVCTWAVLTLLAPETLPVMIGIYLVIPVLSGIWAAISYKRSAERIKREITLSIAGERVLPDAEIAKSKP